MNKFSFTIMTLLVMMMPFVAFSQNDEVNNVNETPQFNDYFYLSGDLGMGLLDGENTSMKIGMNGHIGLGYQFDKYFGIKGNIGYGSLNGGLNNLTIDKLNYFEANINLTFDLTHIIFGYNPERRFSAVPHIGLGQIQYRIDVMNEDGSIYYKAGYRENGKPTDGGIDGRKIAATIPMGMELNYLINQKWKLYLDLVANYTDSDLLDGVNGDYKNDWFYAVNLGTSYNLGSGFSNVFKTNENFCNYWFMTLDGGATFLLGDNSYNFSTLRGNANIGIGYDFHNFYRIYAKLGKGSYVGHRKEFVREADGNYFNVSLNMSADIIGLFFGYNEDRRFTVYPHVGVGQSQYRVTIRNEQGTQQFGFNNDNEYNTKGDGINGRRIALTFPLGIELVYTVNEKADLYADATSNLSQGDMFDGVASGDRNDAYTTVNVGLRYKFNRLCTTIPEEECITAEEIKEAVQEAIDENTDDETPEETPCMTPEDLKQAIKDAIEEYEASRPKNENVGVLSPATVINNNYSDIEFPQNKAQKVSTQTYIDAINRASNQVEDGSAVNRIIVEGYASPEGNGEFNERLALERAEQAVELIKNELGDIDTERIEISGKGADWEGLYEAIAASEIENSEEIINNLKNSSNREETMREMLNKYPQIRQLLPQLRRASIVITTVK